MITSSITSLWNTTNSIHSHRRLLGHTTFFWGRTTEILFSGWPGSSSGMYTLALLFVFFLAVLVEFFGFLSDVKSGPNKVALGFFRTGMYAVRAGMSYLVMLAVMSFNGGVFLVAVAGHAVGFVLFGPRGFFKNKNESDTRKL